jgi:hypothetical protein
LGRSTTTLDASPFNPEILEKDVLNYEDLSLASKETCSLGEGRHALPVSGTVVTAIPPGFYFVSLQLR